MTMPWCGNPKKLQPAAAPELTSQMVLSIAAGLHFEKAPELTSQMVLSIAAGLHFEEAPAQMSEVWAESGSLDKRMPEKVLLVTSAAGPLGTAPEQTDPLLRHSAA
jgi:hypothetical protein